MRRSIPVSTGQLHSGSTELSEHDWLGFDESLRHLRSVRWLQTSIASNRIVYRASSLIALRAIERNIRRIASNLLQDGTFGR
jgi:hypothetical protein